MFELVREREREIACLQGDCGYSMYCGHLVRLSISLNTSEMKIKKIDLGRGM